MREIVEQVIVKWIVGFWSYHPPPYFRIIRAAERVFCGGWRWCRTIAFDEIPFFARGKNVNDGRRAASILIRAHPFIPSPLRERVRVRV
jgi:hypothetical protein